MDEDLVTPLILGRPFLGTGESLKEETEDLNNIHEEEMKASNKESVMDDEMEKAIEESTLRNKGMGHIRDPAKGKAPASSSTNPEQEEEEQPQQLVVPTQFLNVAAYSKYENYISKRAAIKEKGIYIPQRFTKS
ncbi:hypothetical protein ACH5RR_029724 [Cinchona calisaya]|uniref:Uncharacterized protein n=1 Tax=Cinchona calisaya TaxID=153742 RepID=A0ABD2YTQ1_9GENT